MNGEPLQIISVDGNSATEQQTIQVDAEGRHFINATAHDGQPLEVVFWLLFFKKIKIIFKAGGSKRTGPCLWRGCPPGSLSQNKSDLAAGKGQFLVAEFWIGQLIQTESERIQTDQGDQHSFPRIVMMNEDPERKYNLLVSLVNYFK